MSAFSIAWLSGHDIAGVAAAREGALASVLAVDLRDPLVLPLLRPAPTAADYRDERRPSASDRTWFMARRTALRSFVALYAGCAAEAVEVACDATGAPRVVGDDQLFVSVSGRGPFALLGVSSHRVGVDVEPDSPVDVIEDVLHPHERATLPTNDGGVRFLQTWTAKEAWLKALGAGLNRNPAGIAVDVADDGALAIRDDDSAVLLAGQSRRLSIRGFAAIVACVVLAP